MEYGWSLCVQRWINLAEMLAALRLKWQEAVVALRSIPDIPCKAGVYMLCVSPPRCPLFGKSTRMFNALYVGRADDLNRRFRDYQKRRNISEDAIRVLDELPGEGEKIFFVFSVVPVEQLREMEGRLIRCLGPSANKRDEVKLRAKVSRPIPV